MPESKEDKENVKPPVVQENQQPVAAPQTQAPAPAAPTATPQPKKSYLWLWIILGIIGLYILLNIASFVIPIPWI